jgi:signal transduction histidine kinase
MSFIKTAGNMTLSAVLQNRVAKWVLWLLFWTLLGLLFASQYYISSEVNWKQATTYALGDWYVFALLSIPVAALARRFRFDTGKRTLSLAVHAIGSAIFSLSYILLRAAVGSWQSGADFGDAFRPLLVKSWHINLLIYWVIVAVSQAFNYYRRFRERELHASELEKHLAQAKLQALQMQLNPHFLFNTLHSISSLMHKDVEAADRMITRLSDLLRAALDSADTQEVSLRKELELLQLYLGIEQIRFGERLTVKLDVAPDTLEAQVPNLILQPLVENAIRHGIEPRARPGRIELHARRQADTLRLEVRDNGNGLSKDKPAREGVGLSNTRARLRELYGEAHRFELGGQPEGGLCIEMTIPYRTEDEIDENSNPDRRR